VGNLRVFSFAIAVIFGLSLFAEAAPSVAAQRGNQDCGVFVSGGTVQNATTLDVVADGGTAISDSSGGQGNLAASSGGDNNRNRNNNNNNNNRKNRKNRWTAEPLAVFAERLQQTDTASAGNAGVATASANGGAISIGDVNSGGNSGNAISIGDTNCGVAHAGGKPSGGGNTGGGGRGGATIRALPSTGVGLSDAGSGGALLFAIAALGCAALSRGRRLDLRFAELRNR
jgi:hypothetical protein